LSLPISRAWGFSLTSHIRCGRGMESRFTPTCSPWRIAQF